MTTDPYDHLPLAPSFAVTSASLDSSGALDIANYSAMTQMPGAADISPQLSWSGFPPATQSFVVTVFDADAPTPSGFWHWAVANIPGSVSSLDAGAASGGLPAGAITIPNDVRAPVYVGAMPPQGETHRYFLTVHALSVPDVTAVGVDPQGTPAGLSFMTLPHTLARASVVAFGGSED